MASDRDAEIVALARRQHGYVARRQLLAIGVGAEAIKSRVNTHRLLPVYAGVYAVGHKPTLAQDRAFAAVLACGAGSVLSYDTAAAVWAIYRRWTTPFHVTSPGSRAREGIQGHRDRLAPQDRTRQHGLPVTSPARTLLDIASKLPDKSLTRAVNDLRRQHYLYLSELAELLHRNPRHPARPRLQAFLEDPTGPTRSEFEDAFKAFCKRFGLPKPICNTMLEGFEIDAYFPTDKVIVELDGWDFHNSKYSFETDRDRDATMLALGIVTVRITWDRLKETPEREAARLLAILSTRPKAAA